MRTAHFLGALALVTGLAACQSTAPVSPPPSGTTAPVVMSGSELDQMAALINQRRASSGLRALTVNGQLNAAATAHAVEMDTKEYFSHTGANGSSVGDRVRAKGYCFRTVSENIATGWRTIPDTYEGWVTSSGHLANILNRTVTEYGLGKSGTNWVMVFGKGC